MSKDITYGREAIDKVIKGVDAVADIVKVTVGPKGRNVLIRENISKPFITNDGATIAKSIQLKDNTEDSAAQFMIQAANGTNVEAGDGTTTTTILAQSMVHNFYNMNEGANVVQIQKEMLQASNRINDYLKTIAIPVKDKQDIEKLATISSGDENTGKLIASAFDLAGEFGSVIVEDSKTGMDNITAIQGMKLPNGMASKFLYNDRAELKTDLKDVQVLLTQDKLDNVVDVLPILDDCVKNQRKLLIICEDVESEIINAIVMNKVRGVPLNVSIIRLPGFGQLKEDMIQDISIATGAEIISRERGITLKQYKPEFLGEAYQVVITEDSTIIKFVVEKTDGTDLESARIRRVEEIRKQLEKAPNSEREQYNRRISNLISGISVFEVGGNSEVEIKERKLRIEDAINSVQSAKEEGIVPGGGYSYLMFLLNAEDPVTIGEKIVYSSLSDVTRQIAQNAGYNGDTVVKECIKHQKGFNALTGEYENLIDTGVINSAKVDRCGLLNATSVASTIITLGGTITEENEKDQNVFQLQAPITGVM